MDILVPTAMFGFIPLVIGLFALLPARRALIITFFAGWMFLPLASYRLQSMPDYDKVLAISVACTIGALIFDASTLLSFRPRLIDLPAAFWCIAPFLSSVHNGLGPWDGLSSMLEIVLYWGFPYFLGRCYFRTLPDLKELAMGFALAGLVYLPLCWFEFRFSAQLHGLVYAIKTAGITRYGEMGLPFYRPGVFMGNGLIVSMFMGGATICAFYLWFTGAVKRLFGFPFLVYVVALYLTTMLCQVMGAAVLVNAGLAVICMTRWSKNRVFFAVMLAMPLLYIGTRANALWTGESIVSFIVENISERRGKSLEVRFENETPLISKALEERWLGWGRWGRSRVVNEQGRDISITDGLWVIYFGRHGLVGLTGFVGMILLPVVVFCWRLPGRFWGLASVAPMVALCTVTTLYMFDSLMNSTINPVVTMLMGAIAGTTAVFKQIPQAAPQRVQSRPNYPVVKEVHYGHQSH